MQIRTVQVLCFVSAVLAGIQMTFSLLNISVYIKKCESTNQTREYGCRFYEKDCSEVHNNSVICETPRACCVYRNKMRVETADTFDSPFTITDAIRDDHTTAGMHPLSSMIFVSAQTNASDCCQTSFRFVLWEHLPTEEKLCRNSMRSWHA